MIDRANRASDSLTEYPQTHRQKYYTSLDDNKEPGPVAEGELDVTGFQTAKGYSNETSVKEREDRRAHV